MLQPKSQVLQPAEPAFTAVDSPPRYLDRYVDLLSRDDPVPQKTLGLIYELLHRMRFKSAVELIDGESQEGQRLEGHLSFPALLARRSAVRVLPHQRIHNGFGELVRVPRAFVMRSGDYQPAASKRNRELLPAYLACSRVSSKPVIMTSPLSLTCHSHP